MQATNRLVSDRDRAYETAEAAANAVAVAEDDAITAGHAHALCVDFALHMQQAATGQITDIVNRCLRAVFDEPYTMAIEFDRSRNQSEARLVYYRDGERFEPMTDSGGVLDVVAFGCRIAAIMLQGDRRLVLLDEPFKWVNAERQGRVADLLTVLADDYDFQFIMVSHINGLEAGKIIEL